MQEITDARSLHAVLSLGRSAGQSIGLVPTMGSLHAGHARLIARARSDTDLVVVSLFVNPTQFGPSEDFDRYPKDLAYDRIVTREGGVDVLFVPPVDTMYPAGPTAQQVWIDPGEPALYLDGASRPGHFRGVATVVAKLFNLVQPNRAYFGQKDAQQAFIIQRMVRDLAYDISLDILPTVREPDGLAISSRNVYLSDDERRQAPALSHALGVARTMIVGRQLDSARIEGAMRRTIEAEAPLGHIDFITVADAETLRPAAPTTIERDVIIALAVAFGPTRLIDNLVVRFVDGIPHFV